MIRLFFQLVIILFIILVLKVSEVFAGPGVGCDSPGMECPQCEYCTVYNSCAPVGSNECGNAGNAQCSAPQNVSCAPGMVVDYSTCSTSNVTPTVCQLGNAQYYEGNCNYFIPNPEDPDNPICRQDEVVTCGCVAVCAAGTAPSLSSPANGAVYSAPSGSTPINFSWTAPSWGVESASGNRSYSLCVGTNSSDPCSGGTTTTISGANPATSRDLSVGVGTRYWSVKATNSCPLTSPLSAVRSVCVEGYSATNTSYLSAWSAWSASCGNATRTRTCTENCGTDNCAGVSTSESTCLECGASISPWSAWSASCGNATRTRTCTESCGTDNCAGVSLSESTCTECGPNISAWSSCDLSTHKRTRTCTESCGTDNCTGVVLEEDCIGEIRGTLFDASNMSSCPSFDLATGYLVGVDPDLAVVNRSFGISDQSSISPHPWTTITTPQTNSSGNYNVRVYAPATYTFDFSDLSDLFVVGSGPKLTCTSNTAVVPSNDPTCTIQPCTLVNNMSFGFTRSWSGWWQAQGGSIHAEEGLRSEIPTNYVGEQSLILPDTSIGNRTGILSHGVSLNLPFGSNTDAKVSNVQWQVLSPYKGVIYDYEYFNQKFKKEVVTTWDGLTAFSYDDGGRGYQIVKVSGNLDSFTYNSSNGQKIILLVDGNATIGANIVVPNGAFLAVIARGDINFVSSVTRADGWYLADNINVQCLDANSDLSCDGSDVQFMGNGSFVAWEGFGLSRDRGQVINETGPSEKFTYRMDLYMNAPEPMKIVTKKYKPYVP